MDLLPPPPYGIAIYAPAQTWQTYSDLDLGGTILTDANYFYDCYRAVEISNYNSVEIINNSMSCSSNPATEPLTTAYIGKSGIFLKNIKDLITIDGNTVSNWITGINVSRNTVLGTINPSIRIRNNYIDATSTGHCTNAIYLSDVSGNTITAAIPIYINANTITDVNNGIRCSNIKNNVVVYDHSLVELRYNSSGTFSGIHIENCNLAEVKNNTVTSLRGTYGNSDNWQLRGIWVKTSTNNKVYCNALSSLGQCLVFEGACASPTANSYGVLSNSMDNARTGFMLRSSGVIGTQGNSTSPSGNTWNNSFTFNDGRTYTYNTSNANTASILYCSAGGSTLPPTATNLTNVASTEYSTSSGGLLTASSGSAISCPTTELPAGMTIVNNGYRSLEEGNYTVELRKLLAGTETNNGSYNTQQWNIRNFIYTEIKNNPALQEDSTLSLFYIENQNTSLGIFGGVNDAITSGNLLQAAALNNSITPSSITEENQQQFNSIYLSHGDSLDLYSENDILELYVIANQCAINGGNAVYQSRNLLMSIANNFIVFTDSCEANEENQERVVAKTNIEQKNVKLYPNPNTGNMFLECHLKDLESGNLIIYSITGEVVKEYYITPGTTKMNINAEFLESGIYLYETRINGKIEIKDKLIIIK